MKSGDFDVKYGVDTDLRATKEIRSLPKSVWGKASTDVSGWDVTARAELDLQDLRSLYLDLDLDSRDVDLSVHVVASATGEFNVDAVEATKGFKSGDKRVTVTPRFDLGNNINDVVVKYSYDKTDVTLTASGDAQKITVSQQISDEDRFSPTVSSKGDLSLEWEHRLKKDSKVTTTFRPSESLNVKWEDSEWTANVKMPLDGSSFKESSVGVKKDLSF